MMKMKKLNALAAASVAGVALVLGGCASTSGVVPELAKANPNGIVVIGAPLTFGAASVKDICAAFPSDERCGDTNLYKGDTIQLAETSSLIGLAVREVPVLVPVGIEYPRRSLLKVRINKNAPAYFEEIAAIGLGAKDCYRNGIFGRGTTGPGGVICPKYGYDYRNVPGLN